MIYNANSSILMNFVKKETVDPEAAPKDIQDQRPCRKFFLNGYFRFDQVCRYSHNFYFEACENFKFFMKKDMKKVDVIVKEKDDLVDITKRDISEANSEIFRLKREMND